MKRAFPASALLAVLVVFLCGWRPFSAEDDWVWLEIPLASTAEGWSRLDSVHGREEIERWRSHAEVKRGQQVVRHRIRGGSCLKVIMQPVDRAGAVAIGPGRIISQNGTVLWTGGWRAEFPFEKRGEMLAFAQGPQPFAMELGIERGMLLDSGKEFSWLVAGGFALGLAVLFSVAAASGAGFLAAVRARLRRVVVILGKRPVVVIGGIAAVAVLVSCWPVVLGGKSLLSPSNGVQLMELRPPTIPGMKSATLDDPRASDTTAVQVAHRPYSMLLRDCAKQGVPPLWNRYASCGTPLAGQAMTMVLDPLHWITVAWDGEAWAWDVKFVLARWLFCFGAGMCAWLAGARVRVAALTAGMSAFIGFWAFRYNHPATFALCYSPWIVACWLLLARGRSRSSRVTAALGFALASTMVMNSGALKEGVFLVAFLNVAGAAVAILPGRKFSVVPCAVLGGVVFALWNGGLLLLFLGTLSQSATSYDAPVVVQANAAHIIGLFDEVFFQRLYVRELVVNPSLNFFFLCGVVLALAQWRVVFAGVRTGVFLVAAVVPLLFAFGAVPASWIAATPFLANVHHVANTFSLPAFVPLIILSALGWSAWLANPAPLRAGLAAAALFAGLVALYFAAPPFAPEISLGAANFLATTGNTSRFFIAVVVLLSSAALALPFALRRSAWLVCAVSLGVFAFRHMQWGETKFDYYVVNPQERPDFSAKSPAVEFIREKIAAFDPVRVHGVDDVLSPGFTTTLGLESIASAEALSSRRLFELRTALELPVNYGWKVMFPSEAAGALLPKFASLNVRWFLVPSGTRAPEGLKVTALADFDVWENEAAWPRAFFTGSVRGYESVSELAAMDLRRPFAAVQGAASVAGGEVVVSATAYELELNSTRFKVAAPSAGMVVLLECWFEDTVVTLNGKPAEPLRVNHAFRGVRVPAAGDYLVEFSYAPKRWPLVKWGVAAGCVLAVGMLCLARVARGK